uniref:MADF domain-containing protein n=1 Tax=Ditylenchus dipsaci TaxID=166011 RepID=A0A915D604_9BILA
MTKKKAFMVDSGSERKRIVFKDINDKHKFFLCECVEEKSVLWDPSHPEHHLAGPKMSAWLKIDEAFKNVFEDETWTSINTTHRTTKNRVQGKTGDGTEDTEPTWKFWNATSFLRSMKPVTDIQTRISNLGDKSPTEASSHSVGSANACITIFKPFLSPKPL